VVTKASMSAMHSFVQGPIGAFLFKDLTDVVAGQDWRRSAWEWRGLIQVLARNYRVLAPDLRGFGWTDAGRPTTTCIHFVGDLIGLEGWANDLVVDTVDGASHWMPEEQPANCGCPARDIDAASSEEHSHRWRLRGVPNLRPEPEAFNPAAGDGHWSPDI
jgi:hypothetical protein